MSAAIDASDFRFIQDLVQTRSAIVLEESKGYLLDARLNPVARQNGLRSIGELVAQLRREPFSKLPDLVVEALTTNETSFFRDVTPFQLLHESIVPELLSARADSRRINIWCGACSSGQEPYTIAMTLLEHHPQLASWRVNIVATDISEKMIDRTKTGRYSQLEVNRGLPASMLVKYFERKGMHWEVSDSLKRMVAPHTMNLIGPWNVRGPFDVVFLRNVLIYFNSETKKKILDSVLRVIDREGYIFLGGAETTVGVHDGFDRVPRAKASCYRPRGSS